MTPLERAVNRLAKWRTLFTGWQLGTREKGDPEGDAVRDHREGTIIMRAEITALTSILIEKGLVEQSEWEAFLTREADLLSKQYEQRFPGVSATDMGLAMDPVKMAKHGTMEGWKP